MRRTGDATVTQKPGPKPKPKPSPPQPQADQVTALQQKVATLQRQLAQAQAKRPLAQGAVTDAKLRDEIAELKGSSPRRKPS